MTDLKLDWASYAAAKYACENWHYTKKMPVNKTVKIGAWEDGKFIGVIIFSPGATPYLYKSYNLTQQEGCELTRIALNKHKSSVSKILAIALKLLKKSNPKLKLVISFADTAQGHHGGIYQATNWIYVGNAGPRKIPCYKGKFIHERSLSELVKQGKIKRSDCTWVNAPIKHKYLMPLDLEIKQNIIKLAKPYPKRVKSIVADTPRFHLGEDGAEPILTLHLPNSKADNEA